MRGKVQLVIFAGVVHGITPAYAGKSRLYVRWVLVFRDHPRLCGEKKWQKMKHMMNSGSPPPMRGKVRHDENNWKSKGITPAYAGKSLTRVGALFTG